MQLSKEEQILIIMKRKGITKTRLAELMGVSKQNINTIMKDIKTFETLEKILEAIEAEYIVTVNEKV